MKRKTLVTCLDIALKNNTPAKHPQWDYYHHYSFIVQHEKIIEFCMNRRSSPLTLLGYPDYSKMHSEIDAYFKARGILEKNKSFEVVNIRLTKTNRIVMSQPCPCCYSFLSKSGASKIWFTTAIENFACMIF